MCGIAGFLKADGSAAPEIAGMMTATLAHRGPDNQGTWASGRVALGHSRLSIIDLDPRANQPMVSDRFVITFNGEIYNFAALRDQLPGHSFTTGSDTEVLLAAVSEWGLMPALERFVGMFAFALWDRETATLHLVRDRVGIKPLYYGWSGSTFLFGSELKALKAHPQWRGEVDRNALALFFRHSYIPSPYSIYRNIRKVRPGTVVSIEASSPEPREEVFWSAPQILSSVEPFTGTDEEATSQLESILTDAVQQRLVSDVPLGAFLSGGIDSSTIVSLMRKDRKVNTFTIGFADSEYDEAPYARAIAEHLGTNHTELTVTPEDAMAVIPRLPGMYDEPFADSSQIPTHLLSAMTRASVTVALSGDGGDELFCGYRRYRHGNQFSRFVSWMPQMMRSAGAAIMQSTADSGCSSLIRLLENCMPSPRGHTIPGGNLALLARLLRAHSPSELATLLSSHRVDPLRLVQNTESLPTAYTALQPGNYSFMRRLMMADLLCYHPDDILTKVDRASMAVGLEVRVPLVDHRVIAFALSLPDNMLIRGNTSKWLLRQVLNRHLPENLVDRQKSGFAIPIASWLQNQLRPWAEDLLNPELIRSEGLLNPELVQMMWQEQKTGKRDWKYDLWNVLMFEAWYRGVC